MIKRNMYVIAVQDLPAAALFYQNVLGFSILEIGDDGWRLFKRDECQIMAGHCPDSTPAHELGDHSYFAYIVINDADQYFAEISARGAELTKPLKSEPWGMREFGIRTNDGHRIMFGQEIGS